MVSVHSLNYLRYSLQEYGGGQDMNWAMKSSRWCITILVGLQTGGLSASTDSVVCQKFEEPDLTHIELKLGHVDRYDNPFWEWEQRISGSVDVYLWYPFISLIWVTRKLHRR